MSRRLYYIFPDVKHCKDLVDELLLKRIDISHMHVIAREGTELGDLPEASIFQRSDIKHSMIVGMLIGIFLGVCAGYAFHYYLNIPIGGVMLITSIVGAIFGAWASSMIGMTTPNSALKNFQEEIDNGKLLFIVDIPKSRFAEIEEFIKKLHPEANFNGVEPTVPPFP